ncbi:MAG TPA: hypothetical protein VLQ79_03435, partial [Myxococcaceae bacterium]|nr:hypothetical protein [Myxococcaceae bacterium]
ESCRQLRWKLETALYTGMIASMQAGEPPPSSAVEVGLSAEVPQLRVLALKLATQGPARTAAAVAALESPYSTVRVEASEILRSDESKRRLLDRQSSGPRPGYPIADRMPDPARLKVRPYPGATYRWFASGPELAFFTTPDAPDRVVAFYSQAGRKAYGAKEFQEAGRARAQAAMDPNKMMKVLQDAQEQGQDPAQAMMAWQRSLSGLGNDPTRQFEGKQGIVSPRYIPADDLFSRVVVVFRDESLGATAVAVPLPSEAGEAAAAMATGDGMMQKISRDQYLQKPIIDSPPPGD